MFMSTSMRNYSSALHGRSAAPPRILQDRLDVPVSHLYDQAISAKTLLILLLYDSVGDLSPSMGGGENGGIVLELASSNKNQTKRCMLYMV